MGLETFVFEKTTIDGLILVKPQIFTDGRGLLIKTFEQEVFWSNNVPLEPTEELFSNSGKGVLRGIHFQRRFCQDKLIRVPAGAVYDVAVDLRFGSPTFGRWEGFYLTDANQHMLYLPQGFAHGFLSLKENSVLHYLCGGKYDPDSEDGIAWDDPTLAIQWPLDLVERVILSKRDRGFGSIADFGEGIQLDGNGLETQGEGGRSGCES